MPGDTRVAITMSLEEAAIPQDMSTTQAVHHMCSTYKSNSRSSMTHCRTLSPLAKQVQITRQALARQHSQLPCFLRSIQSLQIP